MKTARDSFLSFTTFVLLYALVGTFLNVAFTLIDYVYPPVADYFYYGGRPSVSFGLATLVVITPLLLGLLYLAEKLSKSDPDRLHTRVRKIFTYLTLFFAGGTIVGNLITAVYYLFDGRDFTSGFIAKSAIVLAVAGAVFWYYISDLLEKTNKNHRLAAGVLLVLFVVVEIGASFAMIGSPATNRALRYDDIRAQNLQSLQSEVLNYRALKEALPATLAAIEPALYGNKLPVDPETEASYEYRVKGMDSFELCATFGRASDSRSTSGGYLYPGMANDTWTHNAGRTCFTRTVDPDYLPTKPSPIY